jgi:hypothetical protein
LETAEVELAEHVAFEIELDEAAVVANGKRTQLSVPEVQMGFGGLRSRRQGLLFAGDLLLPISILVGC